jgi:uncharacterized protein (TIGR04222 family)
MKRPLLLTALVVSVFVGLSTSGMARADEGWVITGFTIEYRIGNDGTLAAKETIRADFGSLSKHGIFRYFYERVPCGEPIAGAQQPIYSCPPGSNREYEYDIQDVTRLDGTKWKYEVSRESGKVTVKIGDADVFVSGPQDYVITYTVRGALDAYEDHGELYWDATGEWPVSILQFRITATLPGAATAYAVCYQGYANSNEQCPASAEANVATFESNRELAWQEQVTIAVGWREPVVAIAPPMLEERLTAGDLFTLDVLEWAGLLLSLVIGVVIVGSAWWRYGRDRAYTSVYYLTQNPEERTKPLFARQQVVVEYLPPEELKPAQMGVLLDERADTLDVTATIVDLAVRGYLHITELPKKGWFGSNDWKLTRKQDATGLNAFEKKVFDSLFKSGDEVEMSDLRYKFAADLEKAKELIYDDAMKRKWFTMKPETARGMWVIVGIALLFLGAGLAAFAGLYLGRALMPLGLVPAGIAMLVLSRSMAKRTAAGSEMLRRVLGFRLYIATAEKHRQEFNERENIFARYLPFAIVFGCVSKWAKAFEGLDDQVQQSTSSWYSGTGPFRVAAFSSGLQSFSSSVSSTLASTRSSSGGSGFSGGSSGGGGGGGGGGSW